MRFNTEPATVHAGQSIVLVGLMGAGKTAIGKRLAARIGLPFYDGDQEIEQAAGITISEIFQRHGEAHFRAGEKRVIQRLLNQGPIVLAPGGGAFLDPETRALIKERAVSIWLNCPLSVLISRVKGRTHRPLLNNGDPAEILRRLSAERNPIYATADIVIHGSEDPPEVTTETVLQALTNHVPMRRSRVCLSLANYDVLIGTGLLSRAGALMSPHLPKLRCIVVTDETVASLHLPVLRQSLEDAGIAHDFIVVNAGESSKSVEVWNSLIDGFLAQKVDRLTTIVALGGGVIGDLAGFAAATTLRGLPFIQIPTTLLSQVDSSVGGKTGINSRYGKNLIGAFHQPRLVLADTGILASLPIRERRAGYAEIFKSGLIADVALLEWCEINAEKLLAGDLVCLTEAVEKAVSFKARIVGDDEREEKPSNGRALLNFGHTFAHALEAEAGYGGDLLHGEAVAIGLVLATQLSADLGYCPEEDVSRVSSHLAQVGLPTRINAMAAQNLLSRMKQDKKIRDGKLSFVLTRGFGRAFTCSDVSEESVRAVLLAAGAI
jgi:shikimate kinase/3-dehydroquinate synthase